ncbi:hypothetical protein F5884DRAFT_106037 [Xylogone sp. PMI_703]|nr:hypothetical protein F5884DRAFT_106037 [Xylogone sp. PMI_703]
MCLQPCIALSSCIWLSCRCSVVKKATASFPQGTIESGILLSNTGSGNNPSSASTISTSSSQSANQSFFSQSRILRLLCEPMESKPNLHHLGHFLHGCNWLACVLVSQVLDLRT